MPEPPIPHDRDHALAAFLLLRGIEGRRPCSTQPVSHRGVAQVEGRQDGEKVAADVGADVVLAQLALDQLHRGEDGPLGAAGAKARRARLHAGLQGALRFGPCGCQRDDLARRGLRLQLAMHLQESAQALEHGSRGVFPRHRQHVLAVQRGGRAGLAQDGRHVLLDKVRLAFFHQQHGALAFAEAQQLVVHQRVGHVHHIQRDLRVAVGIGQIELLQRPDQGVVAAALTGNAQVSRPLGKELVEPALLDEAHGGRPALPDLLLLVQKAGRRQHDAAHVALRLGHGLLQGVGRTAVVAGGELAMHVAGADAQLQHHRGVAGLGQLETVLHRLHDARQVGARIEHPYLRLHRKGMAAFLHDGRALAVVLANDDQRPALDAARGQVGQRVGGHIRAHRGLEGHRAAQRIVDRCGQRGGGRGLAGAVLEADAMLDQDVLGVGQHIHQMRDGSALVARDVVHARLQQSLCHCQDALTVEYLAGTQTELLDLLDKRTFCHRKILHRARAGTGIDDFG